MKVKELIAELQLCDPELTVFGENSEAFTGEIQLVRFQPKPPATILETD